MKFIHVHLCSWRWVRGGERSQNRTYLFLPQTIGSRYQHAILVLKRNIPIKSSQYLIRATMAIPCFTIKFSVRRKEIVPQVGRVQYVRQLRGKFALRSNKNKTQGPDRATSQVAPPMPHTCLRQGRTFLINSSESVMWNGAPVSAYQVSTHFSFLTSGK